VFYGAQTRWYLARASWHISRIGVTFRPGSASPFFGPAVGQLHDLHVPLGALWGRKAAEELREQLLAERTPKARFQTLECILLDRLTHNMRSASPRVTHHPAVAFALEALCASLPPQTTAQLVETRAG
jgi:hypothetical protein